MIRDFDEIILCLPGIGFLFLNILHFASSFCIIIENTDFLLALASPIVILELISIIPLIASFVFVFIFRSEILASLFTLVMLLIYVGQALYFWHSIIPAMLTYVEKLPEFIPFI